MTSTASVSEQHGIELLGERDLAVYSVGISTGGVAEAQMAALNPERHIIATTIDKQGADFAKEKIAEGHLSGQVEVKLEDVAQDLPYNDDYFDYIYARLVLHYLPKDKLKKSLSELYRTLKPGGRIFIVVRSSKCDHAHMPDSVYDPETEFTEYTETDPVRGTVRLKRHFFSEEDLVTYVKEAGFAVSAVASYDEHLFKDFKRTVLDTRVDNLVELIATKK